MNKKSEAIYCSSDVELCTRGDWACKERVAKCKKKAELYNSDVGGCVVVRSVCGGETKTVMTKPYL